MIIPHWVHHVGKPTENSLLRPEIVHTFNLFADDDPGSIIPKHYRRVEIKYSKLGEKRGLFDWKTFICYHIRH